MIIHIGWCTSFLCIFDRARSVNFYFYFFHKEGIESDVRFNSLHFPTMKNKFYFLNLFPRLASMKRGKKTDGLFFYNSYYMNLGSVKKEKKKKEIPSLIISTKTSKISSSILQSANFFQVLVVLYLSSFGGVLKIGCFMFSLKKYDLPSFLKPIQACFWQSIVGYF